MKNALANLYYFLKIIILITVLITLFVYLKNHEQVFYKIKTLSLKSLFALGSLHLLNIVAQSFVYYRPFKLEKLNFTLHEIIGLSFTTELFNHFLPAKAGTIVKMSYLKKTHGLNISTFLSINFALVVTSFSLLSFFGLGYIYLFNEHTSIVWNIAEIICWSLLISLFLIITINKSIHKIFKINRKINPRPYLKNGKLIFSALLIYAIVILLYPLRTELSFNLIGVSLTLSQSIELSFSLIVISLFQILPGNIGVKEAITVFLAQRFGVSAEAAVLASLIDRAVLIIILTPSSLYFYWSLFLKKNIRFSTIAERAEQISP